MVHVFEDSRADCDVKQAEEIPDSDLLRFYKDTTVLITGATGFLGKLCLEKLLRTCDPKKIFIIIRHKKGKDPQKRFEELFDEPSYGPLKRQYPNFIEKIEMVTGDCTLPDLGLSEDDKTKLRDVELVFHFAATVRFDEHIQTSTHINVRATRDLIRLSKSFKQLKCFVHVSTAFSNCNRSKIEETLYNCPMEPEKLINLVDCIDKKQLDKITPVILGDFPNTYAFTKCVAEDLVRTEGKDLTIALYRPSIVIATVQEPVAGWIDNVYGATGVLVGSALGLLHSLQGNMENNADIVPADYVINGCLATAWEVATSEKQIFKNRTPVYNFVTHKDNRITWRDFEKYSYIHANAVPSTLCVWHYFLNFHPSRIRHEIFAFLAHTAPAHVADFVLVCLGKKPMLVKAYQKIQKFESVLNYFTLKKFEWTHDNMENLWLKLKDSDKRLFDFDMKSLNWEAYFVTYTKGARVYLLKDPLDTIPQGRKKLFKLKVAHYTVVGILLLLLFKLVTFILSFLF